MKPLRAAVILTLVQFLLVLSIAGKYLYERHTRPRVWVRAGTWDPNTPLRGRYLSLQLLADACALPRDPAHRRPGYRFPDGRVGPGFWSWNASLEFNDGKYQARLADRRPATQLITLSEGQPCDRVPTHVTVPLYIPDTAKTPLPLKPGEDLWVEVTVPKTGPPRPIQLALSTLGRFTTIHFN
ncbi:hypothetical protein [Granulicella sibirica]|uniref:Uncharacterized protein n=1 Tax=Granulicella sibirica TaxID=2479048 RepID=A0A4Q0T7G9_9BACT|nr:hypothetical protein [Granulicella sibirica]RXH57969.1 hypothetical protein GRAN_1279 [Granulicella sibirica]